MRDRNQQLEETQDQAMGKDELVMQLRMELDELTMDNERSFEQKNMKREYEKASLAEKKAIEEVQWLKNQLAD